MKFKPVGQTLSIGIDVVELRSYHYHTGLMYAVYAPNRAAPLAQGGRYDGIGEHFGRARPATGFSCDLYALSAGQFTTKQVLWLHLKALKQIDLNAIADARVLKA